MTRPSSEFPILWPTRVPVDGPTSIPWSLIASHEKQAHANHSQTLARLAERGGLAPCEAVAVLEDRRWHRMPHAEAVARLREIVANGGAS